MIFLTGISLTYQTLVSWKSCNLLKSLFYHPSYFNFNLLLFLYIRQFYLYTITFGRFFSISSRPWSGQLWSKSMVDNLNGVFLSSWEITYLTSLSYKGKNQAKVHRHFIFLTKGSAQYKYNFTFVILLEV